jgi:hypothetical protein
MHTTMWQTEHSRLKQVCFTQHHKHSEAQKQTDMAKCIKEK